MPADIFTAPISESEVIIRLDELLEKSVPCEYGKGCPHNAGWRIVFAGGPCRHQILFCDFHKDEMLKMNGSGVIWYCHMHSSTENPIHVKIVRIEAL